MTWLLETLPAPLRTALIHGSEGAPHLASCARLAREAGLDKLAEELLLAAWTESPLDAGLAGGVAALPDTSPVARELAAHIVANSLAPKEMAYYQRLAVRRDLPKIKSYLSKQSASEPGNLFWVRLSLAHALDAEDWDWAATAMAGLPEPLARLFGGDVAMLRRDARAALADYTRCARLWECPGLEARQGLAHLAAGEAQQAGEWLQACLVREPWRVQALLVMHDHLRGSRSLPRQLEGQVEILFYTFNKAQDIDRTLASLSASGLGGARITVLDNGSTDATPDVLRTWRERLGQQRFVSVDLPVNVGAPAARNWLMSLPQVRASDWVVYLDDDVSLPGDWLMLLAGAAGLYPDAGVWGARVRDFARPAHIQSADVFLVPEPEEGQADSRRFSLSSCHHQTLDRGQFAYVRPCATVTGCCHLFRTRTLETMGGFDLRYSPSQYDDLDHDIRLLLTGLTPVYQGHLSLGHFKSTGAQGGEGGAQYGMGWANQYKLHHKFTAQDFHRAAQVADEAAWRDALAKWRAAADGGI